MGTPSQGGFFARSTMSRNPQIFIRCDACGHTQHIPWEPEAPVRCSKCGSRFLDVFYLDTEPEIPPHAVFTPDR